MSHPDEGTIQALLDGELDAEERSRIELHVRGCAECAARLAEAQAFLAEADRLVELVVVPQAPGVQRAPRGRRALVRTLAWAASIAVAVAAGYWGRGTTVQPPTELQEGDRPSDVAAAPPVNTAAPAVEPTQPAKTVPKESVAGGAKSARRVEEVVPTASSDSGALAAAQNAAPRPEAKALGQVASPPPAAAERDALDARANEAVAKDNRLADEAVTAWRVVSMEEAVRVLGGQIRLIDGLAPSRIEIGPGTAVAGADPGLQVIRVVYAGGTVILDEQRPAPVPAARREAASASGAVAQRAAPGWQQRGDIRFVVTGSISVDSLRALGARVQ